MALPPGRGAPSPLDQSPARAAPWLELEGGPSASGSDQPFEVLDDWAGDSGALQEALGVPFRGGASRAVEASQFEDGADWWQQLREALRRRSPAVQMHCVTVLQLLTCNAMTYFYQHLSPRNAIYLALSGIVFMSAWLPLDPSGVGWSVGLVYVAAGLCRCGALEPLWSVAAALAAHVVFDGAPEWAHRSLWIGLGIVAVMSEACWWPSAEFLIQNDFKEWVVHFSTYYAIVIDLWMWPQLLLLDPEKWQVVQEIQKAPPETRQAVTQVGAGLAVLVCIPFLACGILLCIVIWSRSPRLCLGFAGAYIGLAGLLIAMQNAPMEALISVGQVPIAILFVLLTRSQMAVGFDDYTTWRAQAALLFVLLVMRHGLRAYAAKEAASRVQSFGMICFQLLCKQWLAAQCTALKLGWPHCFRVAAWAPRRSMLLIGREEAYDRRLLLQS